MSKKLHIAKGFSVPVDALTQTIAILAKRGVGKTHTACVFAEEFLDAGLPVVIVDPVGVWWGLRATATGKSKGYPITIFGGDKGDLPLEETAGKLIADLVVDERLSVVLDLSKLSRGGEARFMTDFAERIYHYNREPLHIIFDEADSFAPQKPLKGRERLLGAIDAIVRRGRARGLGVTLVTQRSAVLNKNVLTQIEMLVVMRTISPQDRAAIQSWIDIHGTVEQQKELMASLPSLPVGVAWFWSPGWLNIFEKVKVRMRQTFDSSATPTVMKKLKAPKRLAAIDLAVLQERMAATIEKTKADDPKELKKQIASLEKELSKMAPLVNVRPKATVKTKEVPVLKEAHVKRIEALSDKLIKHGTKMVTQGTDLLTGLKKAQAAPKNPKESHHIPKNPIVSQSKIETLPKPTTPPDPDMTISKCERGILSALAQYPNGRSKSQVALLSKYRHTSGGFNNALSKLRTKGLIYGGGDNLYITDNGRTALGDYTPLPTGRDLFNHWLTDNLLGKCEKAILTTLYEADQKPMTKDEVATQTDYRVTSGGFNNSLSRLRTLDLIRGAGHELQVADIFFE